MSNIAITAEMIDMARKGVAPEGVALAVTGAESGGEQSIIREGSDIVCYHGRYEGDAYVTTETRRTPMTPEIEARLCASFLQRNNRS